MSSRFINWFKFSAPATFYPLAHRICVISAVIAVVLIAIGLYMTSSSPTDYKQGEGYRIIFVHVPASWMSMFIYLVMAGWAALGLVFNTRLSAMMAQALAPTGRCSPSCLCGPARSGVSDVGHLVGVGRPHHLGTHPCCSCISVIIALRSAIDDPRRGDRASAILLLVGVVNVPIIYYSVKWWNTLHQGSTIKWTPKAPWTTPCCWRC